MTDRFRADRRILFRGLGSLGVAAVLAGCGSDSPDGGGTGSDDAGGETTDDGATGGDGAASGTVIARTDEVPVDGGLLLREERIVLTQPADGEFKAFTAVCTHQQCVVNQPADGTISCGCHGSSFDAATGEVTGGPAPSPLAEIAITVEGEEIRRA